ncbi:WD40 repeat domain-containing protein [Phanerochaete sordida]|uniref:DNA damage-binding protein CMR1 n=1 Tax=Phanerochaete sordida TaxID=48140 RepID=A0A9P3GJ43_9APHY|nr:WD40 repeat domain-containing protein [Phanerochaete sordida]
MSDFEEEREANIARNRALLAQLDITLDIPKKPAPKEKKPKAKPVQPAKKRVKREAAEAALPTRTSTRLRRSAPDPNETPEKKRKREQEEELLRQKLEQEKLEAEERAREAKKPRHDDIEMYAHLEDQEAKEVMALTASLQVTTKTVNARRIGDMKSYQYDEERHDAAVKELKEKLGGMKIVSRAKITKERIYSAAYHPEKTKDLVFFGDKHGALGIWDARAPSEETDEDGDVTTQDDGEGGKSWRIQLHWPNSSRSSISSIKFDPIDAHSVYTSSYDGTIRTTSFVSAISTELYHDENALPTTIDLPPHGHEMWIADSNGGVTHLDLRQDKSKARWYQLSEDKIGCLSVNPVETHFLLTTSNSRVLRIWDARKLQSISVKGKGPYEINSEQLSAFQGTKDGKNVMRGEWRHGKSVTAGYWDPHGRRIVSTSYDDTIRIWDIKPEVMKKDAEFPSMRPTHQFHHNCQTGKWVTMLRAQWNPNPDVYPHFTLGNMDRSLDIRSHKGELIAKLADKGKITAVQAVTCSHPSILERAATGNASGRCVLWAPADAE